MSGSPEDLDTALEGFKQRMTANSLAWWTRKIHSLEDDRSLTNKKRLDRLSHYMGDDSWPTTGAAARITSPSQLLLPPEHPDYIDLGTIGSNGTSPPESREHRSAFLDDLASAVSERAGDSIPLPDEFLRFLELTDGVSGGHLANSMPCGLGGTYLGMILPRTWIRGSTGSSTEEWSVLTGWCTSMEKDNAETQILYARKPAGTTEEARWQWRVCYQDWQEDVCSDGHWFTSIAEFLDYMAGWFERLPSGWEHQRKYVPGLSDSEESMDDDSEEDIED
jgi:hypothetical protein